MVSWSAVMTFLDLRLCSQKFTWQDTPIEEENLEDLRTGPWNAAALCWCQELSPGLFFSREPFWYSEGFRALVDCMHSWQRHGMRRCFQQLVAGAGDLDTHHTGTKTCSVVCELLCGLLIMRKPKGTTAMWQVYFIAGFALGVLGSFYST